MESDRIPSVTAQVARAAFPDGSMAMRIRDALGMVFRDEEFERLFPSRGQSALSPGRLALVVVLQFAEGLSDRQAAQAVRARIDWKYALSLELTDPGFDFSVLSEFRGRLIKGAAEQQILDTVLERAGTAGLLKTAGRARTDSTHVLAAIRGLNRLELAGETLRAALNVLAVAVPDWLASLAAPVWFDRYASRSEDFRMPKFTAARIELAETIGADGMTLLRAIHDETALAWLRQIPAVETLRRVWVQEFCTIEDTVRWRHPRDLPPGRSRLVSPYDDQARTGTKRDSSWDGYKVHITETCEPDAPHLITNVATTPSPGSDFDATALVHEGLSRRGLAPDVHLVDTGYVTTRGVIAAKRDHNVELVGPMMPDASWQTRSKSGYPAHSFAIDWDNRQVTCPSGKTSIRWAIEPDRDKIEIRVEFSRRDCGTCPVKAECTRGTRRRLTLRPQAEHEVLHRARVEQQTDQWKNRYQARQGIEGTIAQGVKAFGLRRTRYRGIAKTHLQHVLIAAAMNLARLDAWLTGTPLAPSRTSHFAVLRPAA
nr:IS1182 family transposase [Sphaerisporangium siamense]